MRVLLLTVGSRGDAEPFCSLASELAATHAHQVDLFLQQDYQHLAPAAAVQVHELPFTSFDFYKYVGTPSHGSNHPNPRVKFVGTVTDVIAELVLPCWESVAKVASQVDAIVTSALARPLAFALGDKFHVPVALVHLQPLVPTRTFPHFSQTQACVDAILGKPEDTDGEKNLESYWELEQFQFEFLEERLHKTYTDLGLSSSPFFERMKAILSGQCDDVWILNAFSLEMIPKCLDTSPSVYEIGPLTDGYIPSDWSPPQDLVDFLENCNEPPICVGYGSMPLDKGSLVLEALERLDQKAVIVGSHSYDGESSEWVKDNVCFVPSAPYAWLLPKCRMMLSHGGAGVVNATLRAGIPAIISPLLGDQFFYAKLLEAKGLGAQAGSNLTSITANDLVDGIKKGEQCREASRQLGERIKRQELGVKRLVDLLESKLTPN